MALTLYAHPFSSYCQKVLVALWEREIPFVYRHLEQPGANEERQALWPLGRFPVLVDDGETVAESSIIIEYLEMRYPTGVRLLPGDADAALDTRFMDRFFDNYVMAAMQKPAFEALRTDASRQAEEVARIDLGARIREVEEGPGGSLWVLCDGTGGALAGLTPR